MKPADHWGCLVFCRAVHQCSGYARFGVKKSVRNGNKECSKKCLDSTSFDPYNLHITSIFIDYNEMSANTRSPVAMVFNKRIIMNNLITEPNFNALGTDASKWTIITHKGVEMKPTVQDSTLRLDISMTTGANWHGELCYAPFPVLAGEIYTVAFSVKAECPFTFSVWLGQQDSPHKSLVSDENHFGEKMVTSEWQTFAHTWKPILSDKAARLNFVFGQIDNVVEIRDVELNKH